MDDWTRFCKYYYSESMLGLSLDITGIKFDDTYFTQMAPAMANAFAQMKALEGGSIANPDEGRMVGHYWLRNPDIAPTLEIRGAIQSTIERIENFAARVHQGEIRGVQGEFKNLLIIGIGGSALGPQFISHALGNPITDLMTVFFFDNTDPDGMDRTLSRIITELGRTLCLVISKSGGTQETRNGMLEAENAYVRAGFNFGQHAVAITGADSVLDQYARSHQWIDVFPMWGWVGGRTSVTSAVGLLPAALQGINIKELLRGAAAMDESTRRDVVDTNPAALMALMWYAAGSGIGRKAMVVLPYKDRLELLSKYMQQLVMESLGKEKNMHGETVHQGLTVYGNKGSTDQHAYVQQLRDGPDNFFVVFVQVLKSRDEASMEVENGVTCGDYLNAFLLGTRQALSERGRESITLSIDEMREFSVGGLVAFFERTVGFYASLIDVNAYNQPGVEAGKKAAAGILSLQAKIVSTLPTESPGKTAYDLAGSIGGATPELIFAICTHLSRNGKARIIPGVDGPQAGFSKA